MFCYECSPPYAFGNFIMAMPVTYCPIWITVLDEGICLLTHRVKNKIANQPLGALDYSPSYMLPSSDYTNREPVWWDSRGMLFITDLGTRIDDVIACLLRAHQARPFAGAQQGPSRVVISPRRIRPDVIAQTVSLPVCSLRPTKCMCRRSDQCQLSPQTCCISLKVSC